MSLLLLITSIANTVAAAYLVSVMNEYFQGSLQEERRQLSIVFGIFSATVIIVMAISFTIGSWGTIVKNATTRVCLEYLFAAIADFPCIFVILYFHHINYRSDTLKRRSLRIPRKTASKEQQLSKSNKSI